MPQLTEKEYEQILNKFNLPSNNFEVLVETGTHYGQTLQNLKLKFKELHSIELSRTLYENCKNLFINDKNIFLYEGDSAIELINIIRKIDKKTVFWLDGHYSSGETAKGIKDCPLVEELECIHKSFDNECLIIIDDFRLFGTYSNEDWSLITQPVLEDILRSRIIDTSQIGDRLILLISKKDS